MILACWGEGRGCTTGWYGWPPVVMWCTCTCVEAANEIEGWVKVNVDVTCVDDLLGIWKLVVTATGV